MAVTPRRREGRGMMYHPKEPSAPGEGSPIQGKQPSAPLSTHLEVDYQHDVQYSSRAPRHADGDRREEENTIPMAVTVVLPSIPGDRTTRPVIDGASGHQAEKPSREIRLMKRCQSY